MAAVDVRFTLPPAQKVVGPDGVIVGVEGAAFTVTTTGAEADEVQPVVVTETVYEPLAVTVKAWVVAPPGLQTLPVGLLLVKTTVPGAQKVSGPEAVTVGVAGIALIVKLTPLSLPMMAGVLEITRTR